MTYNAYRSETVKVNGEDIEIFKIDHDVNGNPRYVVHFLSLVRDFAFNSVPEGFAEAHRRIRAVGGRKYTAKWFGGGLVFQSYNVTSDLKAALEA
jgi:hypothetical protein